MNKLIGDFAVEIEPIEILIDERAVEEISDLLVESCISDRRYRWSSFSPIFDRNYKYDDLKYLQKDIYDLMLKRSSASGIMTIGDLISGEFEVIINWKMRDES